jgi:hypothetical protein
MLPRWDAAPAGVELPDSATPRVKPVAPQKHRRSLFKICLLALAHLLWWGMVFWLGMVLQYNLELVS